MNENMLQQLAISAGLGLLVGFQREWGPPHVAGIRTFALIPPLGTLCAYLSLRFGGWVLASGLLALSSVLVTSAFIKFRAGVLSPGTTTETAALIM